ncbi:NEW3 domain-containing protein [Thermococcus barophilus]|uniref:Alpha-galactosidase NEW3 domain-containing protein n=1 Tax=Thermococcus barophilus TaxID=55802 RepID=A0A0S1X9X6_THEBA|nr:NEW3 domain-containing protein [Thermococcus barophilus]ALM74544.1 conserved exported hypothetical protein [Thermococcus barophilus]
MKKLSTVMLLFLLLSSIAQAQPWIEVFQGKVKIGETLIVGKYQIKITQEKETLMPYAIIYKGNEIIKVAGLNDTIEAEKIRIIPGSFNPESEEVFLVVQYEPSLFNEIKPKAGLSFSVNGYSIKILNSSEESAELSINGAEIIVKSNTSRVYDKLAFVYNGEILRVYYADVSVKLEEKRDYEIYYPFESLNVKAGEEIRIPISIINNGNDELQLPVQVTSKPPGWDAKIIDGQSGYEVGGIILRPKSSAQLFLDVKIPEDSEGVKTVTFAVGEEIGAVKISVTKESGMEVKVPILGVEAEAGETLKLPVEIINKGKEKEVTLEVKGKPQNWNVYFMLNGQRVRSALLDKQLAFTLVIETPRNADLGMHSIAFSVNGIEKRVSVFIYKTHKGEPAKLILTVKDEDGNFVGKAEVTVGNETAFTDSYGKVELEVKSGKYLLVIEKEGYEKFEKIIKLEDGEEKSLDVTLVKLPYYFTVEGQGDIVQVKTGGIGTYTFTINNLGKTDDTYSLSCSGMPEGWSAEFYVNEIPVKSVQVDAGKSKDVLLRIIPPFNAQPGNYNITISIKSSSGIERTLSLMVKLVGEYRIELYPQTPMISVKAGNEGRAVVTIQNSGTAPITNVKFEVSAPQGWDVRVIPESIPELKPMVFGGGNVKAIAVPSKPTSVQVIVKVPKTTPAGTYQITITAKGDQAQASTQITVRVTQSSKSAYLGILILLLTFGAVIWMMRRVGRR